MKERLIILSDLWGTKDAKYINNYTKLLDSYYDIKIYDSCTIGQVDISDYSQENLHKQFVNGGIKRGVEYLCQNEKEPLHIIAFSVGGVIAWKYGLKTNNIKSLVCVSSNRLRYETEKPRAKVELIFGTEDRHLPSAEWMKEINVNINVLEKKGHEVYTETEFTHDIISRLKKLNGLV